MKCYLTRISSFALNLCSFDFFLLLTRSFSITSWSSQASAGKKYYFTFNCFAGSPCLNPSMPCISSFFGRRPWESMVLAKSGLQRGLMDCVKVYLSPSVGPCGGTHISSQEGSQGLPQGVTCNKHSNMVGSGRVSNGQ